jgi:hypothetical protein
VRLRLVNGQTRMDIRSVSLANPRGFKIVYPVLHDFGGHARRILQFISDMQMQGVHE